jgi:hypothetical protein
MIRLYQTVMPLLMWVGIIYVIVHLAKAFL